MRLVSLVNRDYWIALETLAWSLSRKGKVEGLEWFIIWDGPIIKGSAEWLQFCGFYPKYINVDDFDKKVPEFPIPWGSHVQPARNKLLAWLLPPDDNYLLLDVDMVCKQNARELLFMEPTSAHKRPGVDDFCSGFMVFRPSEEAFDEMINDIVPNNDMWKFADQEIINIYYRRHGWKRIPWKWNLSQHEEWRQLHWPKLYNEAIFVHYHGSRKPWAGLVIGQEQSFMLWHRTHAEARESYAYICKKPESIVINKDGLMEIAHEMRQALLDGKRIKIYDDRYKKIASIHWKDE